MRPTINERDEKLLSSIVNPDSMLLGPALPSAAVLENLTERLQQNPGEFEPKAMRKVLFYIAQYTQPEQAARAIIPLATSREMDPLVRQDAINSLGLLPPEFADTPLATTLKEDREVSESNVLKALARAGDKNSFKALKSLEPTNNANVMKLRAYAETMIALRLGKKISADVEKRTLPTTSPFKFNSENADALKKTISSIEGKPFGLELNKDFGFSFDCAKYKHTILFNSNFKRGNLIKSISKAQLAGIIVMEDQASGRSLLRHSIILLPGKNATRVSVLRTNGEVALAGELRPDGDSYSLHLRDLGTEVRPIQVAGKITKDGIELSADVFQSIAKTKRTGIPLN